MASTTNPPPGEETLVQHIVRSTKNIFFSCVGGVKKSDEVARIKYKELEIRSRKQKFGVDYVDMVQKGVSEDELKKCLETCLKSIETTVKEIDTLQEEIDRVDAETKSKVQVKPGTVSPPAAPAPAPAPAPEIATEPPTAKIPEAPVPAPAPAPETETEAPAATIPTST